MFQRAVVFRNNHTTVSRYLRRREIKSKSFDLAGRRTIDAENFMITKAWRGGWKWNTITYYYVEDDPLPLPFSSWDLPDTRAFTSPQIAKLWTPWFYRTISPTNVTLKDIHLYLLVGIAGASIYLIMLLRDIRELMQTLLGA